MPGYIHHVEWSVGDVPAVVGELVGCYGFRRVARRRLGGHNSEQVALRSGRTVFLISPAEADPAAVTAGAYPLLKPAGQLPWRDTLFNVCLEVGDVDAVTERARAADGEAVLIEPATLEAGSTGSVRMAAVKSCVGNVVHTIVNTKSFDGCFLPGFQPEDDSEHDELTSYTDHVTYVVRAGESKSVLDWYGRCFGMVRFLVNSAESPENGVVVGSADMRLTVGEWMSEWMCSEVGAQFTDNEGDESDVLNFKLVLAETLASDGRSASHVQKFLNEHGCPGLQHIGLTVVDDVTSAVDEMQRRGAAFRRPPPTYYRLESKMSEIVGAGWDLDAFRRLGLLVDTEADPAGSKEEGDSAAPSGLAVKRSLVQIFTKPLFSHDTFFLEVLQRAGARGFGVGNITVLAESIELYRREVDAGRAREA